MRVRVNGKEIEQEYALSVGLKGKADVTDPMISDLGTHNQVLKNEEL